MGGVQCEDVAGLMEGGRQYSVLAGWTMWVHPHDPEARKLWEWSTLTSGRVADGEAVANLAVKDEEAVAGGI